MELKEKLKKLAAPLLIGAVMLTGVAGYVYASSPKATTAAEQETQAQTVEDDNFDLLGQKDYDTEDEKEDAEDAREEAALAAKAKISKEDAVAAAKAAYPEYAIREIELDDEDGKVIYEIEMTDAKGTELEVEIDAVNGGILHAEKDIDDDCSATDEQVDVNTKAQGQ